jgi:hypothetical protein
VIGCISRYLMAVLGIRQFEVSKVWWCVWLLGASLSWTPCARAHRPLDKAIAAAEEGLFDQALVQFDRALASGDLGRAELVQLLSQRALVYFALREQTRLAADLTLLLGLEPDATLGNIAPPGLREQLEALRDQVQPVALDVRVGDVPGGVRIRAEARHTPEGTPVAVRIAARTRATPWQTSSTGELRYPLGPKAELEYHVALLGPGENVLLSQGNADHPLRYRLTHAARAPAASSQSIPPSDTPRRRRLGWSLGLSAAVLGAAAVVVGLLVRQSGARSSEPGPPDVEFP